MPTGTTSYLSRSSMEWTKRAEASEISCSAERPPKMSASLSMPESLVAPRWGRNPAAAAGGPPRRWSIAAGRSRGEHRGDQLVDERVRGLHLFERLRER